MVIDRNDLSMTYGDKLELRFIKTGGEYGRYIPFEFADAPYTYYNGYARLINAKKWKVRNELIYDQEENKDNNEMSENDKYLKALEQRMEGAPKYHYGIMLD